jgi:sugar phosphate isomerase/epimerase
MPKIPIALQMYTLRNEAEEDFAGTIQKVAEIGYSAVELAGHGGLSVQKLSSLLADNYLKIAGSHVPFSEMENDLPRVIEENLSLGNRYVVVPSLPPERRKSVDDYQQIAEALNRYGESLQRSGMTLCYHNHDYEFESLENGLCGEDILLQLTDSQLVKAEVDAYWMLKAGQDPVAFLQKHPSRVPLLHLKDLDPSDGSFAPVGTGTLPLAALIDAAHSAGVEFLIVEQDICKGPALDAVALSYNNLKTIGYA